MTAHARIVDLTDVIDAASGGPGADGVHWTLDRAGDLNANLVRLEPDNVIEQHVNHAVDVLLVIVAGSGTVSIDGEEHALLPRAVVDIPRGTGRRIRAAGEGLWYLTVHRRRAGVHIDLGRS